MSDRPDSGRAGRESESPPESSPARRARSSVRRWRSSCRRRRSRRARDARGEPRGRTRSSCCDSGGDGGQRSRHQVGRESCASHPLPPIRGESIESSSTRTVCRGGLGLRAELATVCLAAQLASVRPRTAGFVWRGPRTDGQESPLEGGDHGDVRRAAASRPPRSGGSLRGAPGSRGAGAAGAPTGPRKVCLMWAGPRSSAAAPKDSAPRSVDARPHATDCPPASLASGSQGTSSSPSFLWPRGPPRPRPRGQHTRPSSARARRLAVRTPGRAAQPGRWGGGGGRRHQRSGTPVRPSPPQDRWGSCGPPGRDGA